MTVASIHVTNPLVSSPSDPATVTINPISVAISAELPSPRRGDPPGPGCWRARPRPRVADAGVGHSSGARARTPVVTPSARSVSAVELGGALRSERSWAAGRRHEASLIAWISPADQHGAVPELVEFEGDDGGAGVRPSTVGVA